MTGLLGQTARSVAYHHGPNVHADHYLYRCFDADGVLLYIGCTTNVRRRIEAHRRGERAASRWLAVTMTRHEVEGPIRGRDLARDAEKRAIQAERPLFNYQHQASVDRAASRVWAPIARYLIDHGHDDLALDTTCRCWRETRDAGQVDPWCVPHTELTDLPVAS